MSEILEAAEAAWRGESRRHPWRALNVMEEVAPRTWFASSFANMTVLETDEGFVVVDPGAQNNCAQKLEWIRQVSNAPIHTVIYSHGHHDHIWGAELHRGDAAQRGHQPPHVVAHEAVAARFDRYAKTAGWNGIINLRQFRGGAGTPQWNTNVTYPDTTYRHDLDLEIGGERIELHHARGETDDATWLYVPARRVLITGDLFVWVVPNAGNPQKVQRYAAEWAAALRRMAATDAELLLPGHGTPIVGRDRVQQALGDTARYLESLEEQTVALMNQGLSLDEVVRSVEPPADLLDRPYLQPVYDEPDFIVRNIWRLYGGWYDGTPSHLKPAPEPELAAEVASLAGSATALAGRARALADAGNLALACHLIDWAWQAEPDDPAIREARGDIYRRRSEEAQSTMAVGIFRATARDMGATLEDTATMNTQDRRPR